MKRRAAGLGEERLPDAAHVGRAPRGASRPAPGRWPRRRSRRSSAAMIASTSPRPKAAMKSEKAACVRTPRRVPAEAGEQVGLRVAGHRADAARRRRRSGRRPPPVEPRRPPPRRARGRGPVAAGRGGEVPAVHEVVGDELPDVLVHRLLAVGQVHGAVRWAASRAAVHGCLGRGRRRAIGGRRRAGRRRAGRRRPRSSPAHERRRPAVLADDVVDEVTNRPLAARRRRVPLVVGAPPRPLDPPLRRCDGSRLADVGRACLGWPPVCCCPCRPPIRSPAHPVCPHPARPRGARRKPSSAAYGKGPDPWRDRALWRTARGRSAALAAGRVGRRPSAGSTRSSAASSISSTMALACRRCLTYS